MTCSRLSCIQGLDLFSGRQIGRGEGLQADSCCVGLLLLSEFHFEEHDLDTESDLTTSQDCGGGGWVGANPNGFVLTIRALYRLPLR